MCVILVLNPGVKIPQEKLYNAVYNNPDGYGLILKDSKAKKLQVIRKVKEDVPNDPKEIEDLLDDNIDLIRYLHVRYKTDGDVNMDNCHPFTSYFTDKRQVFFMHNGILGDWKPKSPTVTYINNVRSESGGEDQSQSDSKRFNDLFLAPLLIRLKGEKGFGDIEDPMLHMLIEKYWNAGSTGLLISNEQDHLFINRKSWSDLDFDGNKFMASNNTYFNELKRGPEYDRRKKEESAKRLQEEAARRGRFQGATQSKSIISPLAAVNLKARKLLTEELSDMFEDNNIWTAQGLASLNNMHTAELEDFVKHHPTLAVALLSYALSFFSTQNERYERAVSYIKQIGKQDSDAYKTIIKESESTDEQTREKKAA